MDEAGSSTSATKDESLTIQTHVSLGWEPKSIFLHRSVSASTPLLELGQMHPTSINLARTQQEHRLEGIVVSVEPFQLPSARGFLLLDKKTPSMAHEIEKTKHSVSMPDSLISAPDFAKKALESAFFQCYKVSVRDEESGKTYDLDCDQEWSLSALGMVIEWKPTYEGIVQKRTGVNLGLP
jgi:hypothetical protein